MSSEAGFIALKLAILTISDTRNASNDTSGNYLNDAASQAGHQICEREICRDDKYQIRALLSRWIADPGIDGIITTGGTGLTGRDGTPEAVAPLFDKTIDGFGEMFRALSFEEIGTSTLQSRAIAGVANGTFIFCVPGSTGACRTAWEKLINAQLDGRTKPCNLVQLKPRLQE